MRSGISWPVRVKATAVAPPGGHAIRSAGSGIPVKAAPPGRLCAALLITLGFAASAALAPTQTPAATAKPAASEQPQDALGRSTPRGSVIGFLAAGRKGDNELASHYLNTTVTGEAAQTLAQQLFLVLDTR